MRRLAHALSLFLALGLVALFGMAFAQQGVTVVDDFGRVVTIPSKPMRIISTAPSITETLFALGLGDRVVGVTSYCNYPPEVLRRIGEGKLTVIGDFANPSLEKIIGLNPDLVIGHNLLTPELVEKLEDAGIPVVVLKTAESIEGVYEDIKLIGKACWAEAEASKLIAELRNRIEFWEDKVREAERVEAAEISWINPIWVAGNGTYIHDVIEHAGGRNVFSDKSWWATVSDEELIERDPSVLIVPYKHGQELIYDGIMEMKRRGLIHGKIYPIDPDIMSRPGPRVVTFFEEVVKALHPEIWEKVVEVRRLIAPQRAVIGDLVTIFVEVRNPGNVGGEKTIGLTIDGKDLIQTIALDPGETRLLNFTFIAERNGTYVITAENLSTVLKVSPTTEKVIENVKESFKRSVEEVVSPLQDEINSLKSEVSDLSSIMLPQLAANLSEISDEIAALDERIGRLSSLATASMIMSMLAIVAVIAVAILMKTRAG